MTTLDGNRDALFATVRNLQLFSTDARAARRRDAQLHDRPRRRVTAQLDERAADRSPPRVHELGIALDDVARFVKRQPRRWSPTTSPS